MLKGFLLPQVRKQLVWIENTERCWRWEIQGSLGVTHGHLDVGKRRDPDALNEAPQ